MADEKNNTPDNKPTPPAPTPVAETTALTHHSIVLNGQKIDYTVTTGTIILKEEDVDEGEKQ
ncbi:MAG: peptidase S10, partial [Anaerolineaceae bacterium]|nr:peptidase S10 [Anaerolineaceae bacterium]